MNSVAPKARPRWRAPMASTLQARINLCARIAEAALRDRDIPLYEIASHGWAVGMAMAQLQPQAGMAATIVVGPDRYGATVTDVTPTMVWARMEDWRRLRAPLHVIEPGGALYHFARGPEGELRTAQRRLIVGMRQTALL